MRIPRNQTVLLLAILAMFLLVNIGGISSSGMMMHDGTMQNCPYMGIAALCHMSPLEHIQDWMNLFAAISQESSGVAPLLLLLLCACASLGAACVRVIVPDKNLPALAAQYLRREPILFNTLRLAFARGLIHPKIF